MSYYWFNRKNLLKKAHDKYHEEAGKEKAAKYYERNKEEIKKKQRERYKSLSKKEKDVIRDRSLKRYYKSKDS